MTDKNTIDEVNVSKCKYFNNGWCLLSESCDAIRYRLCGDMTLFDCYYRNWQRKEQECEELKRLICKQKNTKIQLSKLKDKQYKEFCDMKQTLTEIKEIAEGMHDLWINKTPYTDMDNLIKHLLECELNRIRYKLDEISECEAKNE